MTDKTYDYFTLGTGPWYVVPKGDRNPAHAIALTYGSERAVAGIVDALNAQASTDDLAAEIARAEAAEARVAELEAENARLLAENYKQTKAATARAEKLLDRAEMAEALLAVLYRAADDAVWNMPDWHARLRAAVVKVSVRGNVTREDASAAYEYLAENRKEQGDE